ncbi:MAG: YceD family protein [Coriobacteriales bacterium]|nr:YceD family protein [Coriobacteriales bacterium]
MTGTLPLDVLSKGALSVDLRDGLAYDLLLSNTGNGILLTGSVSATGTTECSRCLEPASLELTGEVEGYFITNPRDEELELADDEFALVPANGEVDLAPAVSAAAIFELPQVVLCQPDCRGLCPHCGVNLNVASCDCASLLAADHPFAALGELL